MTKIDTDSNQHIPSFCRRQGRITPAQRHALDTLWSRYGLDLEGKLNFESIFGRISHLTVEIGFGNGSNLADCAEQHPDRDFLGIEVHKPGIGRLLIELNNRRLHNVKVCRVDAVMVLRDHVPSGSIDLINIFFPDPWPKKRHHKRRLISPEFVSLASRTLKPGGYFHTATDWENYAQSMRNVLDDCNSLSSSEQCENDPCLQRSLTRFEQRGLGKGHRINDLIYRKTRA